MLFKELRLSLANSHPLWNKFTTLDKRDILDYAECIGNGRWYEPPVSFHGLAKILRAAVHHSSPIYVKRNILASTFIPHPMMSQQEFSKLALDYLVCGNAFAELRRNGKT